MALETFLISLAVTGLATGLQLLFQPTPPKQKVGGEAPDVPKSDYGKGIPLIYGKFKVSTNWIFPNKKDVLYRKETTTESVGGGGKGGGGGKQEVEKTEYFATFACLICEGPVTIDSIILNDKRYTTNSEVYQKYVTLFDGTQTQPWSVIENKDDNPKDEIIYKDLAYLGFEDLPQEFFDFKVDAIVESVDFPENPDLGAVVFDLCKRLIENQVQQGKLEQNYLDDLANQIDVSELTGTQIQRGLYVERSGEGYREALQTLMTLYLFTAIELTDGTIKFKLFQRPKTELALAIPANNFFPIEEGDSNNIYVRKPSPKEDKGIPSKIVFKFFYEGRYLEDQVIEYFAFGEEHNILTLSPPLATYPNYARELIFKQQKFLSAWQRAMYEFIIPASYYSQIDLLSLIQLPNGEVVQIYDVSSGNDYLLRITASSYGGELDLEFTPTNEGDIGENENYTPPTIPDVYILDIRQIEDYPPSTLYVLATHPNTLWVSLDGGVTTNTSVSHLLPSTIGNVLTPLPNNGGGLDLVNTIDIELESGLVEGISQAQFDSPNLNNLALLAVQQPDGYYDGKFIQFRDVQALGNNQYRLSYIFQGWYDSQNFDTSNLPLKFFLLKGNGAYYSTIVGTPELIGQSVTATPVVSSAQNLATTPTVSFSPSGNSYKPPAVTNLQAEEDKDGNIRLSWEYNPLVSSYTNQTDTANITFDVVVGNNVRTITTPKTSVIYLISDRNADLVTKPFDATVYAVSPIVGRGNGNTLTVNTTPSANIVFGTGESGFNGTKFLTNADSPYTVQEEDNRRVLYVTNPNATFTDLVFPDTLSNGFECVVVADRANSDINSRVQFLVSNLLSPTDNQNILAGSTAIVSHTGLGNYIVIANNRKFLQVNDDGSIEVRKTWNFKAKNYQTPNPDPPIDQSIVIDYFEDFGDRSNLEFSVNDVYFSNLISGNGAIVNLQSDVTTLQGDVTALQGDVSSNSALIADLDLDLTALENSYTQSQANFNEDVQDVINGLLVAGTNITLTYNDVANSLTIDSTGGSGGASGSAGALAQYYAQGNLPNTDRVVIATNKAIQSIKLYNANLNAQDVRIATTVNGETFCQLAFLLPSETTIAFKYKYPLNLLGANDTYEIECSASDINWFCEYSDANTDGITQGIIPDANQTAIYTATGDVTIPLLLLINTDTVNADQVVTILTNKGGILTKEKVTLLSGQTIDASPDYSISLSNGDSILLECSVGSVGYFLVTI